MRRTAHIHLKSESAECRFEWLDFDGDDCFKDFHIEVRVESTFRRLSLGPCPVIGLRKFSRFFRDPTQMTLDGGCCDVHRTNDGYRLILRDDASGAGVELYLPNPQVELDDEFMRTVYSS